MKTIADTRSESGGGRRFAAKKDGTDMKNLSVQLYIGLTSWLAAVTAEYLLVPKDARNLAGLSAIAQMSAARVLILTGILFILCNLIFRYVRGERWAAFCAFGVYAALAVRSSFTPAFLLACAGILLILAIFAIFGGGRQWISAPCLERKEDFSRPDGGGGSGVFLLRERMDGCPRPQLQRANL